MGKFKLNEIDYECPYCYGQLEEDINVDGKRFRYCEMCGESFEVDEEGYYE